MFTGIIQSVGHITAIRHQGADARVEVHAGNLDLAGLKAGDSIAVNGCCLTATALSADGFFADVSHETLSQTTLSTLERASPVNLETALTLATPLGGHIVSGHVDGVGEVVERREDGRSVCFDIRIPAALARYVARKGSICVDGVSLTVNAVERDVFSVNIVPHTLAQTIFQHYTTGMRVNIEVDLVARYLERLLQPDEHSSELRELLDKL